MISFDYDQALQLLEDNQLSELKHILANLHPADVAEFINQCPDEFHTTIFKLLDDEMASDVLSEIHDDYRIAILEKAKPERIIQIFDEMETDEAVDLLSELEDEVSDNVLSSLDIQERQHYKKLLSYDEESAGGLMQTEIIAVNQKLNRTQVIEDIRSHFDEVENIHYVYVVDNQSKLVGVLDIGHLLLAPDDSIAAEIMETTIISAVVDMDQEKVANLFRKYDVYSLPVVDRSNTLLGRITVDDIIDVMDDEATEDAYKLVGLSEEDRVFTKPINSVKKRLPWLVLNLLTAVIISSVVGIFESTIAKLSLLAVLMPIVAGLGGNSGTQTLTVITRGIALGELTIHNTWKAVIKEITVGFTNGIIIGSLVCLVAYLLHFDPRIGMILGVAMVCNMFIAGLVGSLIPVILKTLKIDPALASSVIITMLTDIGGYACFLGLASIILF